MRYSKLLHCCGCVAASSETDVLGFPSPFLFDMESACP